MHKRKKSSLIRRILRGLLLCVAVALLVSIVAAYAPFARCREIGDIAPLQTRAVEMKAGIDSADRVMILESRTQALDERLRLLAQAQREIIITSYDCRDGESTRDMLSVVLERADAGVKVRLLADGISSRLFLHPSDAFRTLAAHPNVEIRFYNLLKQYTPWRHMGRMHDKYVIVDDLAYILGGRNMFDSFIGEYPARVHSRDREALVYNADGSADGSIHQVRAYFERMWAHAETSRFIKTIGEAEREAVCESLRARCQSIRREKAYLFEPVDYRSMTEPTRGVWLVNNPTTIYAKEPVVFTQLCELMKLADQEIIIHSPYVALNAKMRGALAEIAGRVPVTLMVNAVENGANVVASGDYLYHKGEVLSTGMHVLEYAGGDSYHGKSMVIDDDIAVIGSFNLDLRSTYVDTELMLVIHSPEVNSTLRRNMDALHADCRIVHEDGPSEVPDGLLIPPQPIWKRIALRALGAAMQLVRNLV